MSLSDDTEASSEALAAAMAAAKTKAEALATAAGVKLGEVIAVRESVVPITPSTTRRHAPARAAEPSPSAPANCGSTRRWM